MKLRSNIAEVADAKKHLLRSAKTPQSRAGFPVDASIAIRRGIVRLGSVEKSQIKRRAFQYQRSSNAKNVTRKSPAASITATGQKPMAFLIGARVADRESLSKSSKAYKDRIKREDPDRYESWRIASRKSADDRNRKAREEGPRSAGFVGSLELEPRCGATGS